MEQPFDRCPVCGGELVQKKVEKLVRGGDHTAILRVSADVCLHYGERFYAEEDVQRFEQVRSKLERQDTAEFEPVGHSFRVA